MLEKPNLQDELIISRLQGEYRLHIAELTFLPLGADVNTAVYRVVAEDGAAYILKLRKGDFDEITVSVPAFLKAQGIQSIIAPLQTRARGRWANLSGYKMILYPFIEGKNGYQVELSDRHWLEFGAALKSIHSADVPSELEALIPREMYSGRWRELVKEYQAQAEKDAFEDPTAIKLAEFMKSNRVKIDRLVERANQLALSLRDRSLEFVLCHSDVHAGNILISENDALYIVDWDNPIYAPKERDLLLIGGNAGWNDARQVDLFYQGYGETEVDGMALAYYRYERIIQDIAAFCAQLFLADEGGEDREQSYEYCTGQFLPGHEVEIACQTDTF
jgi:spectinomycin phosphotransferase